MQNFWWEADLSNNMYAYYATIKFHSNSITVPGGGSGIVTLDIVAPVPNTATWGDDAINLLDPLYSGWVVVKNNAEFFTLPYVGQLWNSTRWNLPA